MTTRSVRIVQTAMEVRMNKRRIQPHTLRQIENRIYLTPEQAMGQWVTP
jgi:hypothetical protein